ncbi:hypothetical protein RB614_21885 [Phytohabitans sp. ZYX-F-186]|uniref:Uncharacterized protein n=1 Tax=Phytohabitans maris TaxID=3071409 RepID=A0ABU0ZJD3_9ACTN|nr:hypothetical protein [Phytohabitans sp. ZYX-F-186]MDQ7907167.1 hypothetical protein [Phytohabitans sp. ZYX-F-186]
MPLGHHLTDGLSAAAIPVYLVLFALLAALARRSARRMREAPVPAGAGPEVERMRRVVALLPYGTLVVAAFVPLAVGLYLVTTTAWTALEQTVFQRYR